MQGQILQEVKIFIFSPHSRHADKPKGSFTKEIQGNSLLSYYTEELLKCYCVMSVKRLVKHKNYCTTSVIVQ